MTSSTTALTHTLSRRVKFAEYVRRGVAIAGSQTALGERLGLHASRISRVLIASGDSFDLPNCLQLAELIGEPPADVLIAAGKARDAELLLRLFGEPRSPLPADEAEVLRLYRSLEPGIRKAMLHLLRMHADLTVRHPLPPTGTTPRKRAQ